MLKECTLSCHLQDTDIAVCMDGIYYLGAKMPIKRPNNYVRSRGVEPARRYAIEGFVSSVVKYDEHRVYSGKLPGTVDEEDVRGFVRTFGVLRAFNMARDISTDKKNHAFFADVDPAVRADAIRGLHGLDQ
jgi:splicing factor U2AF subunit